MVGQVAKGSEMSASGARGGQTSVLRATHVSRLGYSMGARRVGLLLGCIFGRIRSGHVAGTRQPRMRGDVAEPQPCEVSQLSIFFWFLSPKLGKLITFAYELCFQHSLCARIAEIILYNFGLEFVG